SGEKAAAGLVGQVVAARRRERRLTLQRLADMVGCAKSYLSMVERGLAGPPGRPLLERLERALGLEAGRLVRMAQWEATPPEVRREVAAMQAGRNAARRLAELLAAGAAHARGRSRGPRAAASRSGDR